MKNVGQITSEIRSLKNNKEYEGKKIELRHCDLDLSARSISPKITKYLSNVVN